MQTVVVQRTLVVELSSLASTKEVVELYGLAPSPLRAHREAYKNLKRSFTKVTALGTLVVRKSCKVILH